MSKQHRPRLDGPAKRRAILKCKSIRQLMLMKHEDSQELPVLLPLSPTLMNTERQERVPVDEAPTPYEPALSSDAASTASGDEGDADSRSCPAASEQPAKQPQQRRTSFTDAVSPDALMERLEEAAAAEDGDAGCRGCCWRRRVRLAESTGFGGPADLHDLDAEDELLDAAERERRRQFRLKRKMHYNEFEAVLRAEDAVR
uniref:Protein phosphatase inhibitor 2 n=1 Tax=Macrostomum lignano TaxID=282301 RepID=A0A1I8FAI9_9PLAT